MSRNKQRRPPSHSEEMTMWVSDGTQWGSGLQGKAEHRDGTGHLLPVDHMVLPVLLSAIYRIQGYSFQEVDTTSRGFQFQRG